MYWKFGPLTFDDKFSYMISKHPDNIYDREVKGAHIVAHFSEEGRCFEGSIVRDPIVYLKGARKRNDTNYLFTEADSVSPINITSFFDVMRSATNGSFDPHFQDGVLTPDDVSKKREYSIFFGPWVCRDQDHLIKTFSAFNLHCRIQYLPELFDISMKHAYMIEVSGIETLPQFLQKIIFISHYLTYWLELISRIPDQRVEKYVRLAKPWFNECSDEKVREDVIRKLSGRGFRLERLMKEEFSRGEEEDKDIKHYYDDVVTKWGELHRIKHKKIVESVQSYCKTHKLSDPVIVDWACGEGKLWKKLKEKGFKRVYGFDSSLRAPRMYRTTRVRQMNILVPNITPEIMNPDVLICSEVIEHFDKDERRTFLKVIRDVI